MEKKTKLTITLALAVLVITLSLGTVISLAPNGSGAQIADPIQQEIAVRMPPNIVLTEAQFGAGCAPTTCGVFYVTAPPHEAQTIYTTSPLADRMLFTITCTNTEDVMTVSIPPLPNELIRTGNSLTFYGQVTGDIKVWPSGSSSEARGYYCATIVEP
jgi:hypothetical protein